MPQYTCHTARYTRYHRSTHRTYPEYSWLVLCVVLCYAVGVLCSAPLYTVCYDVYYLYSITLAMLYAYTEVEGYYSLAMAMEM